MAGRPTGSLKDGQLEWLADARRFELTECSVALCLVLGVAVNETLQRYEAGQAIQLIKLAHEYRQQMAELPGIEMPVSAGDPGAIVTFRHASPSVFAVRNFLRVSPSPCVNNSSDALSYFLEKLSSL